MGTETPSDKPRRISTLTIVKKYISTCIYFSLPKNIGRVTPKLARLVIYKGWREWSEAIGGQE